MTLLDRTPAPSLLPPAAPAEQEIDQARLPVVALPSVPAPGRLLGRLLVVVSTVLALLALDRLATVLMDLWLMQSLGYEAVFWTNFWTRTLLLAAGCAVVAAAVLVPARSVLRAGPVRRRVVAGAVLAGLVAGWLFSGTYLHFLQWRHGQPFGERDPVFGRDLGFYVFTLPALWDLWWLFGAGSVLALASALAAGWARTATSPGAQDWPLPRRVWAAAGTRGVLVAVALLGFVLAAGTYLARYGILTRDNYDSSIPAGAEFLDVSGPVSTLGYLTASNVLLLLATVGLVLLLRARAAAALAGAPPARRWRVVVPATVTAALLAVVVALPAAVAVRDLVAVQANEPVIQLPYIEQHLKATRAAWGMDDIETVDFRPSGGADPLPSVGRLLESPTIQNAGLWPGYVSRFERQLDPEYVDRLLLAEGDGFDEIYSTTMDAFRQQQKLRPYYDFMDVDVVRYDVGDEPRLFVSAVREVPLIEPQPWLAWWGQRFVLFTHGFGLVASEVGRADPSGLPVFASSGIPARSVAEALAVDNERVYHGEGSGTMAYSNLERISELDFPTEQGRAETRLPSDVPAGVELDSLLKRAVFGWKSGELASIVFSDLITEDSRVHYFRTPLERMEKVAPFLYLDTDPYAVSSGERITWMVNGLTTADRYPLSAYADLGDKSDRRSPTSRDPERVNYAADTVKATVDAYSGQVDLYRIADEPVVATWAAVYPGLFRKPEEMPEALREQVQYPAQLFHAQFDDLYVYYHVPDAITFFNAEDLWDDADEVVGPIRTAGPGMSFSTEPNPWIVETGAVLPRASGDATFALSMAFTPENALNLRAIATAYQDGLDEDYGRLVVLQVPKGEFHISPEQADAAIDQDAFISQQIGFWNRQGNETIRGHTTPLLVGRELIYVEPIFSRSRQNPAPQLQRVVVVVRGKPAMGIDLEDALRVALEGKPPPGVEVSGPRTGDLAP